MKKEESADSNIVETDTEFHRTQESEELKKRKPNPKNFPYLKLPYQTSCVLV